MLFCYDFPHKKTQDFIFRLLTEGYNINYIIAAPWVRLNIPESLHRVAPHNEGLIYAKKICKSFGIPYYVLDHNSNEAVKLIKNNTVDLCIVAGARILKKDVIEAAGNKILNIHPGILPNVRGLDTLLWSIYYDEPIGISAHFISPRIDLGLLIYKEKLELKKDDTLIDISLRLLEKQPDIMIKSMEILKKKKMSDLKNINTLTQPYNTKMSSAIEEKMLKEFPRWLTRHL